MQVVIDLRISTSERHATIQIVHISAAADGHTPPGLAAVHFVAAQQGSDKGVSAGTWCVPPWGDPPIGCPRAANDLPRLGARFVISA